MPCSLDRGRGRLFDRHTPTQLFNLGGACMRLPHRRVSAMQAVAAVLGVTRMALPDPPNPWQPAHLPDFTEAAALRCQPPPGGATSSRKVAPADVRAATHPRAPHIPAAWSPSPARGRPGRSSGKAWGGRRAAARREPQRLLRGVHIPQAAPSDVREQSVGHIASTVLRDVHSSSRIKGFNTVPTKSAVKTAA